MRGWMEAFGRGIVLCAWMMGLLFMASCAATISPTASVWKGTDFRSEGIHKILVMAAVKRTDLRKGSEDEFVEQVVMIGKEAVPSLNLHLAGKMGDSDAIRSAAKTANADTFLITRFITQKEAATLYPKGKLYDGPAGPGGSPGSWYIFYQSGFKIEMWENTAVQLETALYDMTTEKLLWSAKSGDFFYRELNDPEIKEQITLIMDEMVTDLLQLK